MRVKSRKVMRRVQTWILLLAAVGVGCAVSAGPIPVTDSTGLFVFEVFSVLPPKGEDWVVLNSGDSIQQLTSSVRQMQNVPPCQGSPEWSFQISRITSCSGARAGWTFSSPLTTDKNTLAYCPSRRRSIRRIFFLGV